MEKRYIQTFETGESLQEALDNNELGKPYVAYLEDEQRIDWNSKSVTPPPPGPDYRNMPLTFEILSGGVINWYMQNSYGTGKTIEFSLNDGEWIEITASNFSAINVNDGDIIRFKGDNLKYGDSNSGLINKFKSNNVVFNIYGNIMSLIDSDGFATATTLQSTYTFNEMFYSCTGLTSVKNLIMPATTLTEYCYRTMFYGCTSLTTAPELPATTKPAGSYDYMFANCTSLQYVKCFAKNDSAVPVNSNYWLNNVSPNGTFVKHPDATWESGASGIPTGWTVQDADI